MNGHLVVSDTSPLNYLILIGAVDLLPRLVSGVLIPSAVAEELSSAFAPAVVRQWISNPPSWLQTTEPLQVDPTVNLDRGEAAAISLAVERGIRAVLIDERKGFAAAKLHGLEPLGTLAILEVAAARALINFDEVIARLKTTSFHCVERLIIDARKRLAANP